MYDEFGGGRPQKKAGPPGAPAWMATFADLATLLMCFFVLILSFSEMDVQKYKQIAGSMANAFGVQRDIAAHESPMGTSFVAQEFSPGRPDPTALKIIQQKTESLRPHLDVIRRMLKSGMKNQAEEKARRIREALKDEVRQGLVEVETEEEKVIIRIREKASFPSGSAELKDQFLPVLAKVGEVLQIESGNIIVAGHTDDIPIASARFRSNWELSSSRAVSVLHELLENDQLQPTRLLVEGHGELKPLVPNDSSENRALNRRVEIRLEQDPAMMAALAILAEEAASEEFATPEQTSTEEQAAVEALEGATPQGSGGG